MSTNLYTMFQDIQFNATCRFWINFLKEKGWVPLQKSRILQSPEYWMYMGWGNERLED